MEENETLTSLNTEWIIFKNAADEAGANQNNFKYCDFWELMMLVVNTKCNTASNYGTNLFIIICHYKWEDGDWLLQLYIILMLAASRTFPLTFSITLVTIPYNSYIPWCDLSAGALTPWTILLAENPWHNYHDTLQLYFHEKIKQKCVSKWLSFCLTHVNNEEN